MLWNAVNPFRFDRHAKRYYAFNPSNQRNDNDLYINDALALKTTLIYKMPG